MFLIRLGMVFLLMTALLSATSKLDALFEGALNFYGRLIRTENGMYRDAYEMKGKQSERCSAAAVGVGLVALSMEHELGRDREAKQKALRTLRALNGKVTGFQVDREPGGYFRHFFQSDTGQGEGEYSTIDTAIMVLGARFCANHFKDPELRKESEELFQSVNWKLALAAPDGSRLHMVMEEGVPKRGTVTSLFNEYYLLATLIRDSDKDGLEIVAIEDLPVLESDDLILLAEPRQTRQSSFVVQFPFYLRPDFALRKFARAQALADQRASSKRFGESHFWGAGAGMMPGGGYRANVFSRNHEQVLSPPIIAGFLPVYPEGELHLNKLFHHPNLRVDLPGGPLLPRWSLKHPEWRAPRIEAIDYSSMLYGLAAIHPKLGMKFFEKGSQY